MRHRTLPLGRAHGQAAEKRESAVLELHSHALQRAESFGDLKQLERDRLVRAEHRPGGDPEQEAVADLAGGTCDGHPNGGLGPGRAAAGACVNARARHSYLSRADR